MGLFKKRRYYFTDTSIATDTVIAFVMGGLSLMIELSAIIVSIATKGNVAPIFGILYICAFVMSVTGEIFAWLGNKAQEGGVKGKRISIALNIISLAIPVWIIFMGIL